MRFEAEGQSLFSGNRALGRIVVALAIVILVFFGDHATARTITVDGNPSDWAGISPTITSTVAGNFRSLSVTNDTVFVYFLAEYTSDRFTGCSTSGGPAELLCPFIGLSLDPDLNGTFFCEAGIAIGISLDPTPGGNQGVGRFKPRGNGCGYSFDFPGAVTAVGSGRFLEASVSLSALKQIAPSLTSFDIIEWFVSGVNNNIGRYVLESTSQALPDVSPTAILYNPADLVPGRTVFFDSGIVTAQAHQEINHSLVQNR